MKELELKIQTTAADVFFKEGAAVVPFQPKNPTRLGSSTVESGARRGT